MQRAMRAQCKDSPCGSRTLSSVPLGPELCPQYPWVPNSVISTPKLCHQYPWIKNPVISTPGPRTTFPPCPSPPPVSIPPPPGGGGNRHRLVQKKNATVSYCTGLHNYESSLLELMCTSFVLTHCTPQTSKCSLKALLCAMFVPQRSLCWLLCKALLLMVISTEPSRTNAVPQKLCMTALP